MSGLSGFPSGCLIYYNTLYVFSNLPRFQWFWITSVIALFPDRFASLYARLKLVYGVYVPSCCLIIHILWWGYRIINVSNSKDGVSLPCQPPFPARNLDWLSRGWWLWGASPTSYGSRWEFLWESLVPWGRSSAYRLGYFDSSIIWKSLSSAKFYSASRNTSSHLSSNHTASNFPFSIEWTITSLEYCNTFFPSRSMKRSEWIIGLRLGFIPFNMIPYRHKRICHCKRKESVILCLKNKDEPKQLIKECKYPCVFMLVSSHPELEYWYCRDNPSYMFHSRLLPLIN